MAWVLCRVHSDLEGRSLAPRDPFLPLGLPLLSTSTHFCNVLGSAKVLGHNMSLWGWGGVSCQGAGLLRTWAGAMSGRGGWNGVGM